MKKKELRQIINKEKLLYLGDNKHISKIRHKRYYIFMYLYCFRYCQYYRDVRCSKDALYIQKVLAKYRYRYYDRKRNIYSYKSGVEIGLDSNIGQCCDIWHSGVVINGDVGDNCIFHGNNTIGNKGMGMESSRPTLGDNVDLGVGSIVIGDVGIADNCIIGAGAVVTKSFEKPGSIIVGVPGVSIELA